MKVLTTLLILMITSGCANQYITPLCLPSRPVLYPITIEEQIEIHPDTLEKIGINDARLKAYVVHSELLAAEHNKQFKIKCPRDTE